jgi:16S rRNA C967 or C1407 C5-methylase (RsmB/RsmF family)/NOL1/NOP2/fmu family ribosome biogenesis protein
MSNFPIAFIDQLKTLFSEQESQNILESLEETAPVSIRCNPHFKGNLAVSHENITQNNRGYFLNERPVFTADPAFHAGLYYPQEANSMWIGAVFSFLRSRYFDSDQALLILDLCAAPGGKTTDISARMEEDDLLVANEIISNRNAILFENICKWGLANTVITKADAHKFGEKSPLFDLIFCDAPCSGEGMFRKDRTAVTEWSPDNVSLCTQRQQRIVFDVWNALKPGGFMVYSTCTFNRAENEDNIQHFCAQMGASIVAFEHEHKSNLVEIEPHMYRCLPHKSPGEGLFFCILQKPDGDFNREMKETSPKRKIKANVQNGLEFEGFTTIGKGEESYLLRGSRNEALIQNLPGLVHPGIPIGSVFNGKWKAHPAIGLLKDANFGLERVQLDDAACMQYLKREFIPLSGVPTGSVLVDWNGHCLGTANAVKNGLNNLLPMEWRVRGNFTAHSIVELI